MRRIEKEKPQIEVIKLNDRQNDIIYAQISNKYIGACKMWTDKAMKLNLNLNLKKPNKQKRKRCYILYFGLPCSLSCFLRSDFG